MIEIYQTQVWITWRTTRYVNRFFFAADNTLPIHPYQLASEINENLIFSTLWFDYLHLLISESARFRRVTTRRLSPGGGPRAKYVFPGGGILGGWPYEIGVIFQAVELQWIGDAEFTAKSHSRIGPLGTGATSDGKWNPLFDVSCFAFQAQHGLGRITSSGVPFQAVNIDHLGIATQIVGAQIHWPPSRQITRRRRD